MAYETISVERRDRVAILTFRRPHVLNAFDTALIVETNAAIAELGADSEVRVIVVRGEGRAFSAGFDLKAGAATAGHRDQAGWRQVLEADLAFIMQFWDCPKPTIAAVHGYCIGGAFELSLACDVTIAAQGTRFGAPEGQVRLGRGGTAASADCRLQGGARDPAHGRRPDHGGAREGAGHRQPRREAG